MSNPRRTSPKTTSNIARVKAGLRRLSRDASTAAIVIHREPDPDAALAARLLQWYLEFTSNVHSLVFVDGQVSPRIRNTGLATATFEQLIEHLRYDGGRTMLLGVDTNDVNAPNVSGQHRNRVRQFDLAIDHHHATDERPEDWIDVTAPCAAFQLLAMIHDTPAAWEALQCDSDFPRIAAGAVAALRTDLGRDAVDESPLRLTEEWATMYHSILPFVSQPDLQALSFSTRPDVIAHLEHTRNNLVRGTRVLHGYAGVVHDDPKEVISCVVDTLRHDPSTPSDALIVVCGATQTQELRMSFRSRGLPDCGLIAKCFKGGGRPDAAATSIPLSDRVRAGIRLFDAGAQAYGESMGLLAQTLCA